MRFTIHVRIGKVLYLVDCGLTTSQAADLAIILEDLGYEYVIDFAGSAQEPVGSPLVFISQVQRPEALVSLVAGRCAA